jgi:Flp pilus assembly protein TadG
MLLIRFLHDRKASVAPMLALLTIPLFGFVGAAVDYSRANSTRTAMQSSLDAMTLMLAKNTQSLSISQ